MKIIALMTAADAGSSQTSVPLDLGDLTNFSINVTFSSATSAGTLKLVAANVDATANYVDVDNSSQTVTGGEPHVYNINSASYRYVKLVWTRSAGTGTMSAAALLKELPKGS